MSPERECCTGGGYRSGYRSRRTGCGQAVLAADRWNRLLVVGCWCAVWRGGRLYWRRIGGTACWWWDCWCVVCRGWERVPPCNKHFPVKRPSNCLHLRLCRVPKAGQVVARTRCGLLRVSQETEGHEILTIQDTARYGSRHSKRTAVTTGMPVASTLTSVENAELTYQTANQQNHIPLALRRSGARCCKHWTCERRSVETDSLLRMGTLHPMIRRAGSSSTIKAWNQVSELCLN
jgi:hypothetical protein